MVSPHPLRHLGADQCLDLLASCQVGRVAATMGALPVILPVNYVVFDHGVLFRTAAGTKLDAAVRGIVVAFEADAYDPNGRSGLECAPGRQGQRGQSSRRARAAPKP